MTLKSGTGQACAACKYQRRRCTPECLLAPFFPADQPKIFQNVHRLFGVKNIQNLLKELSPDQKATAMKSIKFHATMRDKYPVYGCMVEIHHLHYQIQVAEEELQAVLQQLEYYRQQQQQQQQPQQDLSVRNDYLSELQLGMGPPGIDNPAGPQYSDHADYGINYLDFKDSNNNIVANSLCQQQTYSNSNDPNNNNTNTDNNNNNGNPVVMHPQLILQQQQQQQQPLSVQQETSLDYNEMPYFDNIADTQSYIGSKEAYESSLESPLKDSKQLVEQMDENELKSAAACFSLTSVN